MMRVTPGMKPYMIAAACVAAAFMIWLYANVDPSTTHIFPRCPVYVATGLSCPGCGTQRALHSLLAGDIAGAWEYNRGLFFGMPFVGALLLAYGLRGRMPRLYMALNSGPVIIAVAVLLTLWMVVRNIAGW